MIPAPPTSRSWLALPIFLEIKVLCTVFEMIAVKSQSFSGVSLNSMIEDIGSPFRISIADGFGDHGNDQVRFEVRPTNPRSVPEHPSVLGLLLNKFNIGYASVRAVEQSRFVPKFPVDLRAIDNIEQLASNDISITKDQQRVLPSKLRILKLRWCNLEGFGKVLCDFVCAPLKNDWRQWPVLKELFSTDISLSTVGPFVLFF